LWDHVGSDHLDLELCTVILVLWKVSLYIASWILSFWLTLWWISCHFCWTTRGSDF
jgi:hypothetical protein